MLPFILILCLAGVFCLAPLALYALWLVVVNRKPTPTVLSGQLDFMALVAGLSGFILFGGGLLLSLLQSDFRILMRGNREPLRDAWGHERQTWYLIVAIYLFIVLGWIVITWLARRRTLLIYNIELAQLESTLVELFEQMGHQVDRSGTRWLSRNEIVFEINYLDATRTGTLCWIGKNQQLFQEVERSIRSALPSLPMGENPIARWLMSFAVSSLIAVVCSVFLLVYGLALVR